MQQYGWVKQRIIAQKRKQEDYAERNKVKEADKGILNGRGTK